MKTNKMMRVASVLLVAVLLTTCAISGTFAKYTADITAGDAAEVALFKVTAFDKIADATVNAATMDLWTIGQVYDTKGVTDYTADGTVDTDIKQTENYYIAPGSWGKFTYTVKNESEVTVNYAVEYTVDEDDVHLEWSINGTDWTEDLADVAVSEDTVLAMETGSKDITVYWRWVFDQGEDPADTALGYAGTAAPTIDIKVTFTQVD